MIPKYFGIWFSRRNYLIHRCQLGRLDSTTLRKPDSIRIAASIAFSHSSPWSQCLAANRYLLSIFYPTLISPSLLPNFFPSAFARVYLVRVDDLIRVFNLVEVLHVSFLNFLSRQKCLI
jgi:hypothetical protein